MLEASVISTSSSSTTEFVGAIRKEEGPQDCLEFNDHCIRQPGKGRQR